MCQCDRLGPTVNLQLLEQILSVSARRGGSNAQRIRDLLSLSTRGEETEDLPLPVGEFAVPVRRNSVCRGPRGQNLKDREFGWTGPWDHQGKDGDPLALVGCVDDIELKTVKGLSLPGHLHQGAIRLAVAIPENVAAAKHLVASFAHDVVGRIAKQPFCAAVPAENPLVLADFEAGFEGAVGDRRGLGAGHGPSAKASGVPESGPTGSTAVTNEAEVNWASATRTVPLRTAHPQLSLYLNGGAVNRLCRPFAVASRPGGARTLQVVASEENVFRSAQSRTEQSFHSDCLAAE